tara:strand:+ start:294 stop:692 length:399 start_codon:yes stop_codon:yes gene_type:complete
MAKAKNTYSWDCKTVDCYPTFEDNADVVYNVHWRLNCTSDKVDAEGNPYVASVYGTQAISTEDIKDFIPFADLDNATVSGWVQTTMGDDEVAELKSNLDANIESQINPTSVTLQIESDSVASEEESSEEESE